jgi:hypothetical protein
VGGNAVLDTGNSAVVRNFQPGDAESRADSGAARYARTNNPQGYQAILIDSGNAHEDWMDFNLVCNSGKWFGDYGAFQAGPFRTYTFVFKVGSQGTCHVMVYDRSAGGEAASKSVTR